jgi:aminoglycoside/choline kinase family phosphotransferase
MNRQEAKRDFIEKAGWGAAEIGFLAGDASNRRYDRLTGTDGSSAVLMDAPPEKGEDVRPFLRIATFLRENGLSAPCIHAADEAQGFLLIEDLGDRIFAREITQHPNCESALYEAATDVLTRLHGCQPPALAPYTSPVTVPLAALAFDWYQPGAVGETDLGSKAEFLEAFGAIIQPFDAHATVLVQRDYHAENLLWLPDRHGPARVGLLDFQDATLGHPVYDLVSILQDARRDVSPDIETRMKARFSRQDTEDRDAFDAAYAVMGAQRNLRILGVFARLCMRDGKAHYIDLIPRVWGHVQTNLAHPSMREVERLLKKVMPEPTPEILARLRSKCATLPKP